MKVHFVGVSGAGMGPLAGLFVAAGHDVSGSDVAFDAPIGPALARWGVRCLTGFDPAHLDSKPDLVVIGNVCRRDNPLARAAIDSGVRYSDMAHAMGELVLAGTSPLVVAGTHGKTTTTALCAWLLHEAGRDPGFLIGGLPKNFPDSFRLPTTAKRLPRARIDGATQRKTPFVVEGDEYDSAFFEKTPKFWHYRPEVAIVTSIEHDHIDIYPTEREYLDAFRGFIERVPESGLVIASANDPAVVRLVRETSRAPIAWFALQGDETGDVAPEWLAAPAGEDASGQSFDLYVGGVFARRFALPLPGHHNIRNALAALAACAQGFGVPVNDLRAPLAHFAGVGRRQELLGSPHGVFVYDDFAHHPTAVRETLAALRKRHAGARLLAVFEARSATACRAIHQEEYARAFGEASAVVLAPLGRNIAPTEALDLARLARDLTAQGTPATLAHDHDDVVARAAAWAEPGDVVALLSNGAFGGVPKRVVEALGARQA